MALVYSLRMTDSTIRIPFMTHNTISLARNQQHINLLSELLIYRGKVTPNKNQTLLYASSSDYNMTTSSPHTVLG